MTFRAFRGSAFNHSHENKAFNELHDLLKQHWENQDEPLYLFGNFFVGGKELDALIVKRNAIIAIDFKNFGGEIKFSENNRWTCDGVPVKGGNSINPYQQLRTNKFALLDFMQTDRLVLRSQPNLGHIAALTLFQQPIEFDELQIPPKIRSWFHIGDMLHAVRTVDSIASASINLPSTDLEILINELDVPLYFPDGHPEVRTIKEALPEGGRTIHWTEGQKKVLADVSDWLEGDTTAFVITGMVNTGKRTVLDPIIESVQRQGLSPLLLAPNGRIAQRYQLHGFEECYSIYTLLYNGQPDRIEKNSSGVGVGIHDVKLTRHDVEGKCLIFVDAHLLGNSFFATDTNRFGTGHLVNDLLEALGDTPPKIALIGDPYQLSRGDLNLSFIHGNAMDERGYKVTRASLEEQLRSDPEQHGLLDFQFDLAEHLKHKHFNRLPIPDGDQVREVNKDPALPKELSTGFFHAVYLCALNEAAHRINLAVKKALRPQGSYGLEVGDRIDFHNRPPVVQEFYETYESHEQEPSYVNAGEIGVVEWVSDQEEVHSILLKGRKEATDLRFKMMRCKVPGLGSVNVRFLPDFLISEKPALSADQLVAMNVFARQEAEKDLGELKTELSRLKESNSKTDKEKYKTEKKRFDMLVNHRVMYSGYFNAARIRFAYAMTVHRGQGREWSHVILNAERSSVGESHHNDEFFRYLYTASACASAKLSLQKYPQLSPLSECVFKMNTQCKVGPFNIATPLHYDRKRTPSKAEAKLAPPRGFTDATPELVAILLTLRDRLQGSDWQIEGMAQHPYQEHYTFINAQEQTVLARLSYKGDYTISNLVWVAEGVDQTALQKLQNRIYGGDAFEAWEVKEAVTSLDDLLAPAGFIRNSVKETSYRAIIGFTHSEGAIELEINVGKTGLASSIRPIKASDDNLIAIVQKLIESV